MSMSVCLWVYVCARVSPLVYTVLSFCRPRSEGWPQHGRTFSIYPCPLSFWLTLPRRVLSTSWCCLSRPCVVFLACVHLTLFLALSLSSGNSLVSSWCDHRPSMLTSLLWRCLTVPCFLFTSASLRTHSFVFFAVHETHRIFLSPFVSKASRRVSSFFLRVQLSRPYVAAGHTSAFTGIHCISKKYTSDLHQLFMHVICNPLAALWYLTSVDYT